VLHKDLKFCWMC